MTIEDFEKENYSVYLASTVTDKDLLKRGATEQLILRRQHDYYLAWKIGNHYTLPVFLGHNRTGLVRKWNQSKDLS